MESRGAVAAGVAVFVVVMILIGWGWWHDRSEANIRHARIEACQTIEGGAERALCLK